jgi:glycosyltransferase involved in cell wall biosynthesis
MKVLYWTELFWPYRGGIELSSLRFLQAAGARGFRFTVVTRRDDPALPETEEIAGARIHRLPFAAALGAPERVLLQKKKLEALLRAQPPDLVHAHTLGPSAFFLLETVARTTVPILLTVHGGPFAMIEDERSVPGRLLRRADWIAPVSDTLLVALRAAAPEIAARSACIHNGTVFDRPPGGEPTGGLILFVGRLEPVKGPDLAIEAFAQVHRRHPCSRLRLAGEGSARGSLSALADRLGVAGAVEFAGWIEPERMSDEFERAAVVVISSRAEGLPQAALEAAARYRPIVAFAVGGLSELVDPGKTGLLVPAGDVEALAAALDRVLAEPTYAREMGRKARARARRFFDAATYDEAYIRLYRALHAAAE